MREVCWGREVGREGGRGMEYSYGKSDSIVLEKLVVEEGGEGMVCVREWEGVGEGEYRLVVEGRSRLGGEEGRGEVVLKVVGEGKKRSLIDSLPSHSSSSLSSHSKRQQSVNCEELWENDLDDLYGITTYPSGKNYFPAAMRGEGVMVMVKGVVDGCEEVDMSKELFYENSTFDWRFLFFFFFICFVSILFILFHSFIHSFILSLLP